MKTWQPDPDFYRHDEQDRAFMRMALEMACYAEDVDNEVPVGAVLVHHRQVLALGHNRHVTLCDPTAHAEIVALRAACQQIGNYRLPAGCTLYVTLEPCGMCAMALIHARLSRLVYAASDPKTGAAGSVFDTLVSDRHNHRVEVQGGLFADVSSRQLKQFFQARRGK